MSTARINMPRADQYLVTKQPETFANNQYPYEPTSVDRYRPSTTWTSANCCDGLAQGFCCSCLFMNSDSNSGGCDCWNCNGCDCNGCDCGGCDGGGCDGGGCDSGGCDGGGCDCGGCNC